jgi:hypothetical protein
VGAFVRKSIEAAPLAMYHIRAIRRDLRDFSRITPGFSVDLSTEKRVFDLRAFCEAWP